MKNIEIPKPSAIMLDKKPYYIMLAVLVFLLIVLMLSISEGKKAGIDYRNFLDDSEIENGKYWLVDGQGLALSKQKERAEEGLIVGGGGRIFPSTHDNMYSNQGGRQSINPDNREYIRNSDGSISYINRDEMGEFIINPDGSKTYIKTDEHGNKYIENPDGARKYVQTGEYIRNSDGSISYIDKDERGEFIINPDGSKTYLKTDENGNKYIENPDGTRRYVQTGEVHVPTGAQITNSQGVLKDVYIDSEGRQYTLSEDGRREYINPYTGEYIRNPDGSISYVGRDEMGEYIINPDGTKSYLKTDERGNKYVENPDGTRRYTETGEHIRAKVINPDGTISEVSRTSRGVVISNPDGTKTNILLDENGNETIIITGEPKAIPDRVQSVFDNPISTARTNRSTSMQETQTLLPSSQIPYAQIPHDLTPEEIEQLRKMKFQSYVAALQAPILEQKVTDEAAAQSSILPNPGNIMASYNSSLETLNALANMPNPSYMGFSGYDASANIDKENFFNRAKQDENWIADTSRIIGHKYEVKTGTVIPGVLISFINSDLPGSIIAQVSQDVYDTASGKYRLIPQGTRIFGTFDSRIIYGQSRVLVAWNRLIFPDGSSMELPSMPGTDQMGGSGFSDTVNNHMLRTFGSAALMSLIVGGHSYALNLATEDVSEDSLMAQLTANLAQQIGQTSATLLEKNLSIQPTIEIRSGYKFNIVLTKDLVFENEYENWR